MGMLFSAGTMLIVTIFNGGSPASARILFILAAVDSVSLLTTKASKPLPDIVKP
jgi:hypothetical protein